MPQNVRYYLILRSHSIFMNQLIAESREFKSKDKIQNSQNDAKLHNNLAVLPWEYFAGLSWTLGDDLLLFQLIESKTMKLEESYIQLPENKNSQLVRIINNKGIQNE